MRRWQSSLERCMKSASQISIQEACHEGMIDQRCSCPRRWPVLVSPSFAEMCAFASTAPIMLRRCIPGRVEVGW